MSLRGARAAIIVQALSMFADAAICVSIESGMVECRVWSCSSFKVLVLSPWLEW